jgi:hypothetical protein
VVPQSPEQAAETAQDAVAGATAAQPQQSNVLVIVRINSPGNDVVSQTNVVTVGASAANRSATKQSRAPAVALMRASAATRPQLELGSARPSRHAAPPARRSTPTPARAQAAEPTHVAAPTKSTRAAAAVAPAPSRSLHQATQKEKRPRLVHAAPAARPHTAAQATPGISLLPQLGRHAVPPAQASTGAARDSSFGTATLAALAAGLVGCAAFSLWPRRRRLRGARA